MLANLWRWSAQRRRGLGSGPGRLGPRLGCDEIADSRGCRSATAATALFQARQVLSRAQSVARDASGNSTELPVPTPRMGSKAKKRSRFRIFSRAGLARFAGCWRWMSEAKIPNELCMLLFVYLHVCLVHPYVRTCGPHQPLPDLQLRFVVTSDVAQQNSARSQAGTEICFLYQFALGFQEQCESTESDAKDDDSRPEFF